MDALMPVINQAWIFVAVLARVTGLVLIAPLLSHSSIPAFVKICLVALVSFIIFPIAAAGAPAVPQSVVGYAILVIHEVAIGLILGLVAMLFFSTAYVAGELVATQMGLNFGTVAGAEEDPELSVLSTFNYGIAILLLLAVNGHHWFFQALGQSYRVVPVGQFAWSGLRSEKIVDLFTMVFSAGFKIAAPSLAVLLMATVGIVILARMVPQMNVFIVGLPIRLGVGLVVLGAFMPLFIYAMNKLFAQMKHDMIFLMSG